MTQLPKMVVDTILSALGFGAALTGVISISVVNGPEPYPTLNFPAISICFMCSTLYVLFYRGTYDSFNYPWDEHKTILKVLSAQFRILPFFAFSIAIALIGGGWLADFILRTYPKEELIISPGALFTCILSGIATGITSRIYLD